MEHVIVHATGLVAYMEWVATRHQHCKRILRTLLLIPNTSQRLSHLYWNALGRRTPRHTRITPSASSSVRQHSLYLRAQRHAWESLHTQRPVESRLYSSHGGNKRSTLTTLKFLLIPQLRINLRLASTHSKCYPSEVKSIGRGRGPGIRRWRRCRRRGR